MKQTYFMVAGAILSTVGSYAQISSEQALLLFEKNNQTAREMGLRSDDRDGGYPIIIDQFNVEDETSNDTMYDSFTVTSLEDSYPSSRDNGISSSNISNVTSNTGMPLLIGNVMDIFADDYIGCIDIVVSEETTNVGQVIFAHVMVLEGDVFVYADQTEDHTITSGENGGPIAVF